MLVREFYAPEHIALRFGVQDHLHTSHSGQDVNGWRIRTPIPSFIRGRVVCRGSDPDNLGNFVTVRAYEGSTSKLRPERVSWCHLDSLTGVPPIGAVVDFGGYVGPLGTSGYSTGPHTHIMVSLTSNDPRSYAGLIDPLPYIVGARTRPAGGDATPFPIPVRANGDDMTTLYLNADTLVDGKAVNGTTVYAIAGDSPGTPANWLEVNPEIATAKSIQIGGSAIRLSAANFEKFKARYLAPVATAGQVGEITVKPDNTEVLAALAGLEAAIRAPRTVTT